MPRPLQALLLLLVLGFARRGVGAQERPASPLQWEGRLDALLTPLPGAHAGGGLNVRVGQYARLGVTAAIGALHDRGETLASGRADATVRFLLDPFAEARRGWYGGAGLSVRGDGGRAWHGGLVLVVGVEGTRVSRTVRAVELALGAGVRLGVALRTRRAGQYR
jgi:hypothetical protein